MSTAAASRTAPGERHATEQAGRAVYGGHLARDSKSKVLGNPVVCRQGSAYVWMF
jgi:hypothetical protein